MKYLLFVILGVTLHSQAVLAQDNDSTKNANPNYDKLLAEKLGSDDYGMKNYFFVILKTGPNQTTDKDIISTSFRGHFDNMNKMVDQGKLIVAGPLRKNENNYRGIFIIKDVQSENEVKELLNGDLAIRNGLLAYEIYSWYGSAALSEYLPFADKIWKAKP